MSAETIYPTFNWKDFALRLADAIRDGDTDAMEDGATDARLFDMIPCPSIIIGGPDGGKVLPLPNLDEGGNGQ